jgi:outer membrane protein assembly factor BamB
MSVTISSPPSSLTTTRRPWLLLLPVVLGLALYLVSYVLRYAPQSLPKALMMPTMMAAMWGPMLSVLLLGLLYVAFGPGRWYARLGLALLAALAGAGLVFAAQNDTRFWMAIWGVPAAVAVLTVVLLTLFHAPAGVRYGAALLLTAAAVAPWELIRMEGVTGDFGLNPVWRWTPTAEERVEAFTEEEDAPAKGSLGVVKAEEGDWPGFRGANRDGRAPSDATHLVELWRRPVGPGWGSVSGVGDRLFTQEQHKAGEVVACYSLKTGKTLWRHVEKTRHEDGPSGAGPRATPTFHEGKLYALGATGVLVCLDAGSGKGEWEANLEEVADVKKPVFGFSCSPLIRKGKVYIAPGVKGPVLVALDARTGRKLWQQGEQETESYSSPQWATIQGTEQVLVFGANGLSGHDPETGKELWSYEWKAVATAQPCVQPTVLPGDRVVVGGAQPGDGLRCVKVAKKAGAWSAALEWETTQATPRFNDVVQRDGALFGLDGGRVFCLDAGSGELRWKTRASHFAAGQVLLVGNRLLVQAERGFLTWLEADPEAAPKPQRVEALTDKTWNHPAMVRGRLIVRNGKEMVCFGPKE